MLDRGPAGELRPGLRDRVLEGLGLAGPPAVDLRGLRALYAAWCARVPFDNVRKMIALRQRAKRPLPGGDAGDFLAHWLDRGCGGTCWPTSNALCELAVACGFEARRVAGSMRDMGVVNHASVKVRLDDAEWLIDSSMLTGAPLPLDGHVFVSDDPVLPAEVEPTGGTHVVWTHTPPNATHLPCRLTVDPADRALYAAAYEASRDRSPFNQRLYARRNRPGQLIVLVGTTRFSKSAAGLEVRELSSGEVPGALEDDIGLSPALIETWVRAGCLDASLEPATGPKPPPVTGVPPSRR